MASRTNSRTKTRPRRRSNSSSRNGSGYSAANGGRRSGTVAERVYREYETSSLAETGENPDVLLDVPTITVDELYLKLAELDAHVAVKAQILDLVSLDVGVDVHLGALEIEIEGVEAQALLKVRLDHVAAIVDRVMTTIDRNPEFVHSLSEVLQDVGAGAGDMLGESGEAVEHIGHGAGEAVPMIGEGAGDAVSQVGQGAGEAVGDLGEGAGQALGGVGEGAGEAVGDLGQGTGQLAGEVGQGLGQTVGGLGQSAGQAVGGLENAVGGLGQNLSGNGAGGSDGQSSPQGVSGGDVAKAVAKEIGSVASEEAKELGLAATRKVKELSEKRRHRKLEELKPTEAAARLADELGVDLREVEGTGADGRITVNDVRQAAEE